MTTIDIEPSWEACARIFIELVKRGEDAEAIRIGEDGILDMGRKLAQVREAQKQAEAEPEPKETVDYFSDYEYGDYLLVDRFNRVQAVSGNSDFWDEAKDTDFLPGPSLNEYGDEYTIVKVIRIHKEELRCTADDCDCKEETPNE